MLAADSRRAWPSQPTRDGFSIGLHPAQIDYKLDLSNTELASSTARELRPYISVHFACCGVYLRIYRSADGLRYEGHCPRCARAVRFRVAPGGTEARMFVVK